ncbi:hypothetical protein [Streptomyces sp. GS7]|uniref:hypothetical protein n=1 Tax=Streptomyces sp. GS7 TaxID=2692234 RepID=UPI001316E4DE|nr:hypothetical protein [Streptomyces sp. GS7]QHC24502.1 hypothetical protein GR130_27150 [Streptomyces sp. GS7]
MFSRNQIAAIAALLGGVAASAVVAPQAYASGADDCNRGAAGHRSCVHRSGGSFIAKDGRDIVVRQTQRCSSASRQRLIWPESGLLSRGDTEIGPHLNCSNRLPAPKELKRLRAEF